MALKSAPRRGFFTITFMFKLWWNADLRRRTLWWGNTAFISYFSNLVRIRRVFPIKRRPWILLTGNETKCQQEHPILSPLILNPPNPISFQRVNISYAVKLQCNNIVILFISSSSDLSLLCCCAHSNTVSGVFSVRAVRKLTNRILFYFFYFNAAIIKLNPRNKKT